MSEGQTVSATITYRPLFDRLSFQNENSKMFQKIVSIGCMISSAVASPILFELQTPRMWFIDILIFFIGSACFMLQNQEGIKQYGPYALAAYTCFGLGAYSSTSTTLHELVPWIPISLCVTLLLTVFFPPKIHELRAMAENNEILMEEGRIIGFQTSPVQPGSVQSDGDIQCREQTLLTRLWLRDRDHDVAFALGRPASRYSSRSIHDSSIALGDFECQPYTVDHMVRSRMAESHTGAHPQAMPETFQPYTVEHMVRSQEAESHTGAHPQAMPETFQPPQHAAGAEPKNHRRSISPDSISEVSEERPLL